jgi:endonuclease/exonuclease/phosphatase family metal-dependent hydrolase
MGPMALRVMTWNLWWRFGDWPRREAAIVETVRSVRPDVLCLQETWAVDGDGGVEHQIERLAESLGLHPVGTDPVFYRDHAFVNAVLSRWPAERIADEALPDVDGEPGHRRIVAASVSTPWGPWPFASTHLDHRFDASPARSAQLRRVLELALGWRGDPDVDPPLVIGADLNAVPDSDEVRMATGRSPGVDGIVLSDVWEQSGDGDGATWRRENPHVADSAWPDRRIDYLLVTWPRPKPVGNPIGSWLVATRPIDVGGEPVWASDHAGVVAELVTPG